MMKKCHRQGQEIGSREIKLAQRSRHRIDLTPDGKPAATQEIDAAIARLTDAARAMQNGRMLYRIRSFEMPRLDATSISSATCPGYSA